MKIAIISDTHNHQPNLDWFLSYLRNKPVDLLIHCGDICSFDYLKYLNSQIELPIYIAFGNCDFDKEKILSAKENGEFLNCSFFDIGFLKLKNKRLSFLHQLESHNLNQLIKKSDVIFYGHTHQPDIQEQGKCLIINPGNLAGLFYRPSFAFYDLEQNKPELKILGI